MSLLPIPCPWSLRLQISRPSLITVITVAGGTVRVAGSNGASVYIRIVAVAGVGANPLVIGIGFTDGITPIVGVAVTTGNGDGAGGWAAVIVAPHPARPAISATPSAVRGQGSGAAGNDHGSHCPCARVRKMGIRHALAQTVTQCRQC